MLISRQTALTLFLLATACGGGDTIGPPAAIEIVAGNNQSVVVGEVVPLSPAVKVRDANGHGLPAIVVRFTVTGGGGFISVDSALTDNNGLAVAGQWTVGVIIGTNSLKAQASGLTISTTITATTRAGPPANLAVAGQQDFAGFVNQPVASQPVVLVTDAFTNPVAGAVVTYAVTLNNGSVTGGTATANAQGRASPGSWRLGSVAGLNRLSASVSGTNSVVFAAQGLTAAPSIVAISPITQAGFLGAMVPRVPQVRVTNSLGQMIGNIPVQFSIVGGGDGLVAGGLALSDVLTGLAAPVDWRFGIAGTVSTVEATIPGFPGPKVTFTSTGVFSPYVVDVRFLTSVTPAQRDAFATAANRWMQIITGDIPDVPITLSAGSCGSAANPTMNETVDDVVIFAQVTTIDGVGGVLGSAGPCIRRTGSLLTAIGSMKFDVADLIGLQNTNRLETVILHEMAHVLGFGTVWNEKGLLVGSGGTDPVFIGTEALSLWPTFNLNYAGLPIPVENLFGAGTRDSHWRESVFVAELMTGFIEAPGVPTPLSRLTIASFKDLGYSISYVTADPYAGNLMASARVAGQKTPFNEVLESARWEVSPLGILRRLP